MVVTRTRAIRVPMFNATLLISPYVFYKIFFTEKCDRKLSRSDAPGGHQFLLLLMIKKRKHWASVFLIYWDFISIHQDHLITDHAFPELTDLPGRGIRFCLGSLFARPGFWIQASLLLRIAQWAVFCIRHQRACSGYMYRGFF